MTSAPSDALGQKAIEMARLHARGADLSKKVTDLAKKFGREVNRRPTKVSNLSRTVLNSKPSTEGAPSKGKSIPGGNGWCTMAPRTQESSRCAHLGSPEGEDSMDEPWQYGLRVPLDFDLRVINQQLGPE